MRVNPVLADSVVFVGVKTDRGFTPLGTGWAVARWREDFSFLFIVTASHIFEDLDPTARDKFVARVNRKDGTAGYVRLHEKRQHLPDSAANDIVLFAAEGDWGEFSLQAWELERSTVEEARADENGVMPGDSVCAIGLYTSHYGQISNKPVVRTGNVAAVADEPIWTKRGYMEAHLIELRTIAGLSGSPVFQTQSPVRINDGNVQHRTSDQSGGIPLGILVGYHVLESREDQIAAPPQGEPPEDQDSKALSLDQRNTGFGLVVPIERVLEILDRLEPKIAAFVAHKKRMANVKFVTVPAPKL